jgi:hypothetical protein
MELEEDLGTTTEIVITNIRREWQKAGRNFVTLKELVEGAHDAIRLLIAGTSAEFGRADVEISRISNLIGERTEAMGTMSCFDMISLLGEDLERLEPLENFVTNHSLRWEENLLSKISAELQARVGDPSGAWKTQFLSELKIEIGPLLRLYTKISSGYATPGDQLEKQLVAMKADIASIQGTVATLRAQNVQSTPGETSGTYGSFGHANSPFGSLWGTGATAGAGGSVGVPTGPASSPVSNLAGLEARLTSVERGIKTLEEQLESS